MGRTAPVISIEQLQQLIPSPIEDFVRGNPLIIKDLSALYLAIEDVREYESIFHGFHVLPNGIPFYGTSIGSDDVAEVDFLIYWDGSHLRAYIPKVGNFFNPEAKTARGLEPYEWVQEYEKRTGHYYSINQLYADQYEPSPDIEYRKMIEDANNTITVRKI